MIPRCASRTRTSGTTPSPRPLHLRLCRISASACASPARLSATKRWVLRAPRLPRSQPPQREDLMAVARAVRGPHWCSSAAVEAAAAPRSGAAPSRSASLVSPRTRASSWKSARCVDSFVLLSRRSNARSSRRVLPRALASAHAHAFRLLLRSFSPARSSLARLSSGSIRGKGVCGRASSSS